ncbi:MAG: hypothetical protein WC224_03065 [Sphaerochaetaceae bacterium]
METGIKLRTKTLFNPEDGRTVTVALDHGSIVGPIEGIENPRKVVKECISGGADAILTTKGIVKATIDEWPASVALVLRLSGGFTLLGGKEFTEEIISEAETALRYGAAWAAMTVKFGHAEEGRLIKQASLTIDRCHALGLPVMLEVMAKGSLEGKLFAPNDPTAIKMAARMGSELGADVIKTYYTGNKDTFREVVEGCPIPILILGGAHHSVKRQFFQDIADSLEAGGKGIAMGRNVWGEGQCEAMLQAIKGLVHNHWSVDEACARVSLE